MSAKNETKEVKSNTDIKSGISASNVKLHRFGILNCL